MLAQILLLGLSASVALGNDSHKCPTPKVQADFDLEKFSGTWYVMEGTPGMELLMQSCSKYDVIKQQDSKASLVYHYISLNTDRWNSVNFEISTPDKSAPGKLLVTPEHETIFIRKFESWVIETDYEEYAIMYTCEQLIAEYAEVVFIISRSKTLDDKKMAELHDLIKKRELVRHGFMNVSQDDKYCKD